MTTTVIEIPKISSSPRPSPTRVVPSAPPTATNTAPPTPSVYRTTTIRQTTQRTLNFTLDLDLIYTVILFITLIWFLIALITIKSSGRLPLIAAPLALVNVFFTNRRTARNFLISALFVILMVVIYILINDDSPYVTYFDVCYSMWLIIVALISITLACCSFVAN